MTSIGAFFFHKLGHFFPIFEKGQWRPPPLPPLVTRLEWNLPDRLLRFRTKDPKLTDN